MIRRRGEHRQRGDMRHVCGNVWRHSPHPAEGVIKNLELATFVAGEGGAGENARGGVRGAVLDVRLEKTGPVSGEAEARCVGGRKHLVIVLQIKHPRRANLFHVGQTRGLPGLIAGFSEDREQDRGKNCDNSDNDQKLDQSEGADAALFAGDNSGLTGQNR